MNSFCEYTYHLSSVVVMNFVVTTRVWCEKTEKSKAAGLQKNINYTLSRLAPEYLSRCCVPLTAVPGRPRLRSADDGQLILPRTSTGVVHCRTLVTLTLTLTLTLT